MSYTDDTVYRLRDALEKYTEAALTYRNASEKNEELIRLIQQHDLTIPSITLKSPDIKNSVSEFSALLNECIYDYEKKSRDIQKIEQENAALESYLRENNVPTDNLFVYFSELQ